MSWLLTTLCVGFFNFQQHDDDASGTGKCGNITWKFEIIFVSCWQNLQVVCVYIHRFELEIPGNCQKFSVFIIVENFRFELSNPHFTCELSRIKNTFLPLISPKCCVQFSMTKSIRFPFMWKSPEKGKRKMMQNIRKNMFQIESL